MNGTRTRRRSSRPSSRPGRPTPSPRRRSTCWPTGTCSRPRAPPPPRTSRRSGRRSWSSPSRTTCRRRSGPTAADWQWGRLHIAAPEHPVLGGDGIPGPVRRLFNPRPLAVGGGSSIVNATSWDAASGSFAVTDAPSMRMVVDLADLDVSTWVTMTGTSGHPGSVHYTDQFDTWAAGETFPWPFSLDAVHEASVRELTLRPRVVRMDDDVPGHGFE